MMNSTAVTRVGLVCQIDVSDGCAAQRLLTCLIHPLDVKSLGYKAPRSPPVKPLRKTWPTHQSERLAPGGGNVFWIVMRLESSSSSGVALWYSRSCFGRRPSSFSLSSFGTLFSMSVSSPAALESFLCCALALALSFVASFFANSHSAVFSVAFIPNSLATSSCSAVNSLFEGKLSVGVAARGPVGIAPRLVVFSGQVMILHRIYCQEDPGKEPSSPSDLKAAAFPAEVGNFFLDISICNYL